MLNIFNNFKRILLEIVCNARIWHLFAWHCDVLHWKSVLTERLYKFCDPKKWLTFQIILFVIWKVDFYNLLKSPKNMFNTENWGPIINHIEPTLNIRLISKFWKMSAWNIDIWFKFIAFLDSSESHKYGVKRAIKSEYIFLVKSSPE